MVTICQERVADVPAREALLDLAFGPCRFENDCERSSSISPNGWAHCWKSGAKSVQRLRGIFALSKWNQWRK